MKERQEKQHPSKYDDSLEPIIFIQNVMIPALEPGSMSVLVFAGEPSPFRTMDAVPPTLRHLVGTPVPRPREMPNPYNLQHFMPDDVLAAEREEFQKFISDDDLDPGVRAELAARDEQHLKDAQSRNATMDEIAKRRDEACDRVARELDEENAALLGRAPLPTRKEMT